jgi:hypothetical protein
MRVPLPIKDFLAWRWAPCVALTSGSLAFVGLAVLLIPSQIDAAHSAASVSAFDRPSAGSRALYSASLAQGAALAQNTIAQRAAEDAPATPRGRAQPLPSPAPVARGFSPILARPDPPAPPPEPAAVTPPAPPIPVDAVPAPPPPPPEPDAPRREN